LNKILNLIRRFLSASDGAPRVNTFLNQTESFKTAYRLVSVFYVCQLYFVSEAFLRWHKFQDVEYILPLWPIFWFDVTGFSAGVNIVMIVFAVGACSSVTFPQNRFCRILAFLGLSFYCALTNSFGTIHQSTQPWVLIAFIFIFLPNGERDARGQRRIFRAKYLSVFFAAQAIILLLFGLAGVWKIIYGVYPSNTSSVSIFSEYGFSYMIAERLIKDGALSPLGPLLIAYPKVSAGMFIVGVYMEVSALFVIFRPVLHRLWGIFFIAMLILNCAILNIEFHAIVLLTGLFLILTPFQQESLKIRELVVKMPLINLIFYFYGKSKEKFRNESKFTLL